MPARRTEFSGGSAEPLCMHLPLPPAFRRVAASLLPSALRTIMACRTSRLKFSAAGRPGPACSPVDPVHFPLSVITAGPLLPSPYCWPGHSERLPAGPLHPFPPCRPGLSSPLLRIRQATCHIVAHWQGERGRNVPAGKELFLPCSICFAAPSATAPIAAGDSACGPRRAAQARQARRRVREPLARLACTHLQLAPQCMHALPTGSAYDS